MASDDVCLLFTADAELGLCMVLLAALPLMKEYVGVHSIAAMVIMATG